jgi:hypothetical protein
MATAGESPVRFVGPMLIAVAAGVVSHTGANAFGEFVGFTPGGMVGAGVAGYYMQARRPQCNHGTHHSGSELNAIGKE